MPGAKRWIFVVNNPTHAHQVALEALRTNAETQWMIFQFEAGAHGTVHIQGAIYFHRRKSLGEATDLIRGAIGDSVLNPIDLTDDSDTDEDVYQILSQEEHEALHRTPPNSP